MCDCILDLISCVGIPLIIVFSYVSAYDPELEGFSSDKWYDDVWTAHAFNEFQLVVVVSWPDLVGRAIFSVGLIFTTTSLKELLRRAPAPRSNKRRSVSASIPDNKPSHSAVGPCVAETIAAYEPPKLIKFGGSYSETGFLSRGCRTVLHLVHLLFGLWGVVVLGLHIQASVQPDASQCVLQVRPWAVLRPSCYLAVLDCYRLGISGKDDEIEAKWSEYDRSSVVVLVMRHCPTLEIPDMLGDFHRVTGIKVYNSTIETWGAPAAISDTNHPLLYRVFFVRVNFTNGVLPEGVQSVDFPAMMYDIEFCYTSLRELPDDLDSKWLAASVLYIEYSQLTSVPLVLTRLDTSYLSLTGNPITELPPEIFEAPGLLMLGLSNTRITELPRNVTNLSPKLAYLDLISTSISYLWSWIDPLMERKDVPLTLGGSTYCVDRDKITNRTTNAFSVLSPEEPPSTLMNASEANWDVILRIDCDPTSYIIFYPIEFEDSISSLT